MRSRFLSRAVYPPRRTSASAQSSRTPPAGPLTKIGAAYDEGMEWEGEARRGGFKGSGGCIPVYRNHNRWFERGEISPSTSRAMVRCAGCRQCPSPRLHGVPSRWAIHIDNIRLRWEASGNEVEGGRMREEN